MRAAALPTRPRFPLRTQFVLLFAALVCSAAAAQTPAADNRQDAAGAQQPGRQQRSERIRIEDAGSRIDELRVGGQTLRISVQPKGSALPGYEVQPRDGARSGGNDGNSGARVWTVLTF